MGLLRDLREVLRGVRRHGPRKVFCPRCGSPEIHVSGGEGFWLAPRKYACDVCGYFGVLVMELEKEDD